MAVELADLLDVGGIDKEFHGLSLHRVSVGGPSGRPAAKRLFFSRKPRARSRGHGRRFAQSQNPSFRCSCRCLRRRPYSYTVPDGMAVEPGSDRRACRSARARCRASSGTAKPEAVDPEEAAADHRASSTARRSPPTCAASSTGSRDYTLSPPGMVARMVLRVPAAFDPEPPTEGLRLTAARPERHDGGAQRACSNWPATAWPGPAPASPMRPAFRSSVIDGLSGQGVFETVMIPPRPVVATAGSRLMRRAELTPDQAAAAEALRASGRRRRLLASRCSTA